MSTYPNPLRKYRDNPRDNFVDMEGNTLVKGPNGPVPPARPLMIFPIHVGDISTTETTKYPHAGVILPPKAITKWRNLCNQTVNLVNKVLLTHSD